MAVTGELKSPLYTVSLKTGPLNHGGIISSKQADY